MTTKYDSIFKYTFQIKNFLRFFYRSRLKWFEFKILCFWFTNKFLILCFTLSEIENFLANKTWSLYQHRAYMFA